MLLSTVNFCKAQSYVRFPLRMCFLDSVIGLLAYKAIFTLVIFVLLAVRVSLQGTALLS